MCSVNYLENRAKWHTELRDKNAHRIFALPESILGAKNLTLLPPYTPYIFIKIKNCNQLNFTRL
jgi:hypothetical protein